MAVAQKPVPEDHHSDSESDDSRDEEGWNDVEADEEESMQVISLLDDRVFPDVMSMFQHCKETHGFDFIEVRRKLNLDFHGCVKLVNYIRHRVHAGLSVGEITLADIADDSYLKPVLDDDAAIIGLFDLPELETQAPEVSANGDDNAAQVQLLMQRNQELQEQLERVMLQYENYRADVTKTLDNRWGVTEAGAIEKDDDKTVVHVQIKGNADEDAKEDSSKYYWESYAGVDIHETMLKDTVRTEAYRDFIYNNKHLFAGKTVLDIGCGTGILSMFCARAGAARVIAVDASEIIFKAQDNIFRAGLKDTITTVHGKIEEVTLPVDKVDIIVSEWMGYCLLFEAMLPSVLYARDKYLVPGGLMVPSHTNMWIAPVSDPVWIADNGSSFWTDVYGFDMSVMAKGLYEDARILHWPADSVCGTPSAFKMLDLYVTKAEDLNFVAPFASSIKRDVDTIDGFLVWFDTFFSPASPTSEQEKALHPIKDDEEAASWQSQHPQDRIAFTTGPHNTCTHWRQGLLMCEPQTAQKRVAGETVSGAITYAAAGENARALTLTVTWDQGQKDQTWQLH